MVSLGRVMATCLVGYSLVGASAVGAVCVYTDGKLRGVFEARGEPYAADAPSVSVYFERRDVTTADGQVVTGLEFTGWQEGQGIRVLVFLLVPAQGAANTYLPEGKAERLQRRYFDRVLLAKGDEVALEKMRELGVEPMELRVR